jgi:hypothetical protein
MCLAHTPSKGLQGFYTGALHIYSEVPVIVALLALGLLIGQSPDIHKQRLSVVGFFITIILSGVSAGCAWLAFDIQTLVLALWALVAVVCLKSALLPTWGKFIPLVLVMCIAVILGQLAVPDPGPFMSFAVTLAGSIAGCVLGYLCSVALVSVVYERYQLLWQRTILRIFSAWMFATSMLMMAVQFINHKN